jgi:hypothetical protein
MKQVQRSPVYGGLTPLEAGDHRHRRDVRSSERRLMVETGDNLLFRWLVGLDIGCAGK